MAVVYSCCFWFSLRLGGIIIGFTSIFQATIAMAVLSITYKSPENVKHEINTIIKNFNLIHVMGFFENFLAEPQKYINYGITLCCVYIIACILYIYGAFKFNNILMISFILLEFLRLILLSIIVITWLIILKQNTMDIGLLIGASVVSGFVLLAMFYLWICAATLPVLIVEMEREEQMATINKLKKLLDTKQRFNGKPFEDYNEISERRLFVIPSYNKYSKRITDPYYTANFIQ